MRRQPKSFTVEIKRRVGAPARKPVFIEMPDIGADSATVAADALLGAAKPAPAPTPEPSSPAGRILPCLVTEAALDAAQAEATVEEAARRRGRSPKARNADETAIVAPRKRGRRRKIPLEETRFEVRDEPEPLVAVVVTPYTPSARAIGRRSAVSALPRGDRWKRRLPRILRHRLSKSPD